MINSNISYGLFNEIHAKSIWCSYASLISLHLLLSSTAPRLEAQAEIPQVFFGFDDEGNLCIPGGLCVYICVLVRGFV